MKKIITAALSLILALSLLTGYTVSTAQTVSQTAEATLYQESMRRMMDLGLFTSTTTENMALSRSITREELAIVLIKAAGQEDQVNLYKNTTLYSDVPASRFSNGYVNAAVKLGYITALADGKFHPGETVTFNQAAIIIGKLLKYDEASLTGTYPQNYITLLSNLDILDGVTYSASKALTRGQTALLIDRAYGTKTKDGTQTLLDTLSVYKSLIIYENAVTNPEEDKTRILTDKGVFYLTASLDVPEAGKKYIARVKDSAVVTLALSDASFTELSLLSVTSGKVYTNSGDALTLPSDTTYYYLGKAATYSEVLSAIKANASLVQGKNRDGSSYAVLFDPLYSEPSIITGDYSDTQLAVRYAGKAIDRGGKTIDASQIESDDVVYEVTDLWGGYGYVLVYNDAVSGSVTAILPNKISPKSLDIDGNNYVLDSRFPISKLTASGGIEAGDTVKVILGSDGTAVDIVSSKTSDYGNYALVLQVFSKNSEEASDYGTAYNYVTLLHVDGAKATYYLYGSLTSLYRGSLVLYDTVTKGTDYDTVKLTKVDNNTSDSYRVSQSDRKLNESYVASDAVVFNITNTYSSEIQATVIRFSDIPSGTLEAGRVKYVRRTGDFQDVDILLVDDAKGTNIRFGLVTGIKSNLNSETSGTSDTLTLLIEGQTYTLSGANLGVNLNSVVRVRMNGNQVAGLDYSLQPAATSTVIDAVDASRIRINETVYTFHEDVAVYRVSDSGTVSTLSISDLTKGALYRSIGVYLDRPSANGGKVIAIILR